MTGSYYTQGLDAGKLDLGEVFVESLECLPEYTCSKWAMSTKFSTIKNRINVTDSILYHDISYTKRSCGATIVNRKTDMVRKAGSRVRICYCSLLWPVTSLRRCTMKHSCYNTVWGCIVFQNLFASYGHLRSCPALTVAFSDALHLEGNLE